MGACGWIGEDRNCPGVQDVEVLHHGDIQAGSGVQDRTVSQARREFYHFVQGLDVRMSGKISESGGSTLGCS